MGDIAWAAGALAGAGGLIAWMVKWILNRERELRQSLRQEIEQERGISNQWRTAAELRQADDRRRDEILAHVLENQRRILAALERLPWDVIAAFPGWSGSPGYDTTRQPRHARPPPP